MTDKQEAAPLTEEQERVIRRRVGGYAWNCSEVFFYQDIHRLLATIDQLRTELASRPLSVHTGEVTEKEIDDAFHMWHYDQQGKDIDKPCSHIKHELYAWRDAIKWLRSRSEKAQK